MAEDVSPPLAERYLKVTLRNGRVESGYRPVAESFYASGDTILVSWYPGEEHWNWEQEQVAAHVPQAIQLCRMGRKALENGDSAYAATLFEQSYTAAAAKGLLYVRPLINISIAYVAENDLESARAVSETLVEALNEVEMPLQIRHMIYQNHAFTCLKLAQSSPDKQVTWLKEADLNYERTRGVQSLSEPDYFLPWAVVKWLLGEASEGSTRTSYRDEAVALWTKSREWAQSNKDGAAAVNEYENKYAELQLVEAYRAQKDEAASAALKGNES